jgi:hypothetical protein
MAYREFVVYEETSVWPWWVGTLVLLCMGGGAAAGVVDVLQGLASGRADIVIRGALVAVGSLGFGFALQLVLGRLKVVVTRTSILVSYGYTGLIQKLFPFEEIEEVEAVRYHPIREFGGWGIRFGGGGRKAWTIRGDGAVVLTLGDGTRFYVGSEYPQRLAEHLRTAMGMAQRKDARAAPTDPEDTRHRE